MTAGLPVIALQQVNRGVLLQGQALIDCAWLIGVGIAALESGRPDAGIPARMKRLEDMLACSARDEAASVSASSHADVRLLPVVSPSLADEITTTEATQMTGLSNRQMCRLAPLLGGRRTTAGWLIPRGAVAAHVHERSTAC